MALRPHPPVLRSAIAPSSLRAAPPPAAPPVSNRPDPAPALALRQASFARDTDSARPRLARAWIPPPSSRAPRLRPPPLPPLPRGRWSRWGEGGDLLSNANTRTHHQSNSFSSYPLSEGGVCLKSVCGHKPDGEGSFPCVLLIPPLGPLSRPFCRPPSPRRNCRSSAGGEVFKRRESREESAPRKRQPEIPLPLP